MDLLRKNVRLIRFLSCRPVFEGSGSSAVVTYESDASPSEIRAMIRGCGSIVSSSFTKLGRSKGMGVVISSRCPCRELGISEHHIIGIYPRDNELVFRMLLPNRKELAYIVDRLKDSGMGYKVLKVGHPKTDVYLTARQKQALVHAFINGYFSYPRPRPLKTISKKMGLSPSAFSETLRRAVRKAVVKLLTDDGFSAGI
jgi:hypothetical protein